MPETQEVNKNEEVSEAKRDTRPDSRPDSRPERTGRRDETDRPRYDDRKSRGGGSKFRKRICRFCYDAKIEIDYKNTDTLMRFVSNKGKILPRRLSGNCAKHQRHVSKAIKQSRMAGLLPFSVG